MWQTEAKDALEIAMHVQGPAISPLASNLASYLSGIWGPWSWPGHQSITAMPKGVNFGLALAPHEESATLIIETFYRMESGVGGTFWRWCKQSLHCRYE